MNQLSARARVFLFLLVVAAPVTATLAFERAAQPATVELRNGGRETARGTSVKPEAARTHQIVPANGTR